MVPSTTRGSGGSPANAAAGKTTETSRPSFIAERWQTSVLDAIDRETRGLRAAPVAGEPPPRGMALEHAERAHPGADGPAHARRLAQRLQGAHRARAGPCAQRDGVRPGRFLP